MPQRRLQEYRKLREPFVEELEAHGVQLDSEVTLNPKGIIRLVGSVHGKTGFIVTPIKDLDRFDVEDVDRVPVNQSLGPATHREGNDAKKIREPDQDSLTGQRLSEQAGPPTRFLFIGTQVIGTINRQVVVLRFSLDTPLVEIRKNLESLMEEEPLAPFFLFESRTCDNAYYALSPSAIEQEHIPRLLKRLHEGKTAYQKFHRRILPLPVNYITQIGGQNPKATVSRAHCNLLHKVCNLPVQGTNCGSALLRIGLGEVRS